MSTSGIYGLSGSGMDVDSLVKVGMLSKQTQYDKMYKEEVKNEWTKDAYATVYNDLSTYRSSTLYNYRLSSSFQAQNADSSQTGVVTATANADASSMTHTVNVTSMASNAYYTSKSEITHANTTKTASIYLKDVLNTDDDDASTLGLSQNEYNAIKTAGGAEYDKLKNTVALSFNLSNGQLYDGTTYKGAESNVATISFTYADLYESNQTLNDLASKINKATDSEHAKNSDFNNGQLGISASFDSANNSFSIWQEKGGSSNYLTIAVNNIENDAQDPKATVATDSEDTSAFQYGEIAKKFSDGTNISRYADDAARKLLNNLGLAKVESVLDSSGNQTGEKKIADTALSFTAPTSNTSGDGTSIVGAHGEDGKVTVDGKEYKTSSNYINVANVGYTLKGIGKSTVSVTQDTDKIIENVKKFVEDYNKILDGLNDKYSETKYSDYDVLTKSQKNSMTQDQIDKWNTKAKSGLLYHDSYLSKILSGMREALYTPVDSVDSNYNSMMAIGISSSTNQGHITLDEDKLKKALAADPDCVYQVLDSKGTTTTTNADGTTSTTTDYNSQGVAERLNDVLTNNLKMMKSYAGTSSETGDSSTLGTLIESLKEKMSTFKSTMDAFEDILYKRYDAMESAIQQLGTSLNYVTGSSS